ncbi:MAG TPA: C13 family peptidase [Pyrinomonadaceae bacterium]|nr:C13 family peptidase [Pyrinomonadaceae bacterium]
MKHSLISQHRARLFSSGALALAFLLACLLGATSLLGQRPTDDPRTGDDPQRGGGQRAVANFVRERVLDGNFGDKTLWMTAAPVDQSYVVRDLILDRKFELRVPYPKAWVVMIDDKPKANFAHDVRWLFVNEQLTEHTEPVKRDFPPLVVAQGGQGAASDFRCVSGVTTTACQEVSVLTPGVFKPDLTVVDSCLYAVLVSGGVSNGANYSRYRDNLRSLYKLLRGAGYPASHISVYYADGSALDLDNKDGDNNDATGSDVTGGANENAIRARIQNLCQTLDKNRDILFTYFTNHGADDTGVCLWDGNNNGLDANELYSPAELGADTANCKVCRHFMIHDQCYSGDFLPLASDGSHKNLAVYAAASATELSWGREYLDRWEENNISATTMNAMHQDVVANGNLTSTPGTAEGTAGIGNHTPAECCKRGIYWPWWWWLIAVLVVVVVIYIVLRRRPRPGPPPVEVDLPKTTAAT